MDRFLTQAQISCQNIIDHRPQIPCSKAVETVGCASTGVLAVYSYKSFKSEERKNTIKKYKYAENIRRNVQAKKMEKLRAEKILNDIGVNPSYLDLLPATRFATLSHNGNSVQKERPRQRDNMSVFPILPTLGPRLQKTIL